MARPRVLITGITGMVGSHLADFLLEKTDWDIVGMCRWRSPMDNLGHIAHRITAGDRVFLHYGDLRDTMSIRDVVAKAKPDYVFILPWNLRDEIIAQLAEVRAWGGQFVVPGRDLTIIS